MNCPRSIGPALAGVLLAFGLGTSGCTQTESAPNVLVIVADDLGWGDVGYNGSEIRTPAIDKLAAEGLKLDRFYVHPVCSPTRAALMTGRSPLRTGVLAPFEPWFETGLPLEEKLLPQYFHDAGYQTFALGKWHLGPNKKSYHPQNRGFDHFYGHLGGFLNYYTHSQWGGVDWQRNGSTVDEEGYSTHLITAEAVRLIENRDRGKPLLLYVAYNAPHSPLQAPEAAVSEYASIEDENRRIYAAMVSEMDRGIGEIRAALESEGLIDNTLTLFMSDNGGAEFLGADNGPLRGGKFDAWEGGIRVPAVLHWPATLPGGATFRDAVMVEDILPTLVAAAGIDASNPNPLDGRNLWPSLTGDSEAQSRPFILAWRAGPDRHYLFAYFEDDWKLVQMPSSEGDTLVQELFRIDQDPLEEKDLAQDQPEVLARMMQNFLALPKAEMHGLDAAPIPTGRGRGGPASVLADDGPPTREPYAESEWRNTP